MELKNYIIRARNGNYLALVRATDAKEAIMHCLAETKTGDLDPESILKQNDINQIEGSTIDADVPMLVGEIWL